MIVRQALGSSWEILHETISRWNRNDGSTLAASMAYYAAFSFFPLLLVLISVLGFVLELSVGAQNEQEQLLKILAESTAQKFADQVELILVGVKAQARINGPLGLVTLLLGAIGIFTQLDTAFDRLWQSGEEHRGFWAAIFNALFQRVRAFLALVVLGLLIIAAFFLNFYLAAVRNWADSSSSWTHRIPFYNNSWHYGQMLLSVALNALIFTLLYKVMPRAKVRWRDAAGGALAVAVLWQIASHVLAVVLVSSTYSAYGVVGAFILMMLWVYCASTLIFLGAQFVQVLGSRAAERKIEG